MAKSIYTPDEVVALMKAKQGTRTQAEFSEDMKITLGFLNNIYKGRRLPSAKVLDFMGFEDNGKTYRIKKGKR